MQQPDNTTQQTAGWMWPGMVKMDSVALLGAENRITEVENVLPSD